MGICEEPASGDTLNRLGASLGYSRAAVESDDDYRVRILVEESVKDFVARNASTWEYIRKLELTPGLEPGSCDYKTPALPFELCQLMVGRGGLEPSPNPL